jgi:hypothetical protein
MNKKVVIFSMLGLAVAGGVAYYFWSKKNTTAALTPSLPSSSSTPQAALPGASSTPAPACKYLEGQLLRAKDKVYYIDADCHKHYVAGNIYSKYKFSGSDIKGITQAELDAIPEGEALQGLSGLRGCSRGLQGYLMWE